MQKPQHHNELEYQNKHQQQLKTNNTEKKTNHKRLIHCLKSVQIRSFTWSVFSPYSDTGTGKSVYTKIRTRKSFLFEHFSHSDKFLHKEQVLVTKRASTVKYNKNIGITGNSHVGRKMKNLFSHLIENTVLNVHSNLERPQRSK